MALGQTVYEIDFEFVKKCTKCEWGLSLSQGHVSKICHKYNVPYPEAHVYEYDGTEALIQTI